MEIDERPKTSLRRARGTETEGDELRANFSARLFAAIRRRDAARIYALAKQAGSEKWYETARPLSDLLVPPTPRWRTPRSKKKGWPEARAAAVWALGQLREADGYRAIARTLACDPEFEVRAAAAEALRCQGPAVIPVLIELLRDQTDWYLDGMRAVLHGLGAPAPLSDADRRAAGTALIDVLYENVPAAPRRWTRPSRALGKAVSCFAWLVLFVALLSNGWTVVPATLMAWIPAQLAGFLAKCTSSMLFSMHRGREERCELYATAGQALNSLNDKRAIPGLLRLAFDPPLGRAGMQARIVLLSLLAQVTPHDAALFSSADLDMLNTATGHQIGTALTLVLLRALESVGNGASIRRVQRLAKRSRISEIQVESARVLEVLEAREARHQLAQTLLRGAPPPIGPAAELLRAAAPQLAQQPEHLLRAVNGEMRD